MLCHHKSSLTLQTTITLRYWPDSDQLQPENTNSMSKKKERKTKTNQSNKTKMADLWTGKGAVQSNDHKWLFWEESNYATMLLIGWHSRLDGLPKAEEFGAVISWHVWLSCKALQIKTVETDSPQKHDRSSRNFPCVNILYQPLSCLKKKTVFYSFFLSFSLSCLHFSAHLQQ